MDGRGKLRAKKMALELVCPKNGYNREFMPNQAKAIKHKELVIKDYVWAQSARSNQCPLCRHGIK